MQPVYALALWRLNDTLGVRGSRLYLRDGDGLRPEASSGVLEEVADEAFWLRQAVDDGRLVAVWVQSRNNVRVGTEFTPDAVARAESGGPASQARQPTQIYVPLRIEARVEGVLVVGPKKDRAELGTEDRQLLEAFANQLAVAVERQDIAEQHAVTVALQESDRLKTALISSVSHELKTPLAAIKASATALLAETSGIPGGVHTELAEGINRETDRLTRLVSNLLDMSRLEAGALRPNLKRNRGDLYALLSSALPLADRAVPLRAQERLPHRRAATRHRRAAGARAGAVQPGSVAPVVADPGRAHHPARQR